MRIMHLCHNAKFLEKHPVISVLFQIREEEVVCSIKSMSLIKETFHNHQIISNCIIKAVQ